jgi:hypothetical protein
MKNKLPALASLAISLLVCSSANAGVVQKGVDGTKKGFTTAVDGTKKGAGAAWNGTKKGVKWTVSAPKKLYKKIRK